MEPPYEPKTAALLRRMAPRGTPISLFRTITRNPQLAAAMNEWGSYELGRELSLGKRERELVITRTCANCRCEYEWGVHIAVFADGARLSRDQIRSLTHGLPGDACWTNPRDQMLLKMVDDLHAASDIPEELWTRLAAEFTTEQLLDLIVLCGWYHAVSFLARSTRLPTEPGSPRFADYE